VFDPKRDHSETPYLEVIIAPFVTSVEFDVDFASRGSNGSASASNR
jgi:hypothetical protein